MSRLVISESVVGSHMWGMNRPDSDTDIFEIYVAPTREVLDGTADMESYHAKGEKEDVAGHEVGKAVSMLIKGNVNFLWGLLSPIRSTRGAVSDTLMGELRTITLDNISKNITSSIRGMAWHNYKKYIEPNAAWPTDDLIKKCNIVVRTLRFGIGLLETGQPKFERVNFETPFNVRNYYDDLCLAHDKSKLPEAPPERPFRDWLYRVRMMELNGEIPRLGGVPDA